jgi:hypothetical protein
MITDMPAPFAGPSCWMISGDLGVWMASVSAEAADPRCRLLVWHFDGKARR